MGHSFRLRLLTSFILPLFVIIPLIGLALVYLLEYQVFIPALAKEMITEGNILAVQYGENTQAWNNSSAAQNFINRLDLAGSLHIDFLDAQGRLVATNQPENRPLVGKPYPGLLGIDDPPAASQWKINPQDSGNTPVLDIFVPVMDSNNQVVGQLHLARPLADIDRGLHAVRNWILIALLAGVLVNTVLALVLSARITNPLRQMTQKITAASLPESLEGQPERIEDQGLSEFDALAHAFNQLQERRYQIETARKQMLANLVHELGRPLGSLQIAVHALLSGAEANANLRLDLLRGMAQRIEWLGHLVDDLALAYLPERALDLRSLPFEPGPWLSSLVPLWKEMAQHKGIEWHSSWPDDLPVINGDPARLEQAIGNLVSNAIKFSPSGGNVSLTAGADSEQFWISVADNGPGITPEDQQHLFEPFFRAESTALKAPGLGLGLSIAKTIAEAHGGSIEVHSYPQDSRYPQDNNFPQDSHHPVNGSQFTLWIPYHS